MRRLFYQRPYMPPWLVCAVASVAFLAIAGALHFVAITSDTSLPEHAMSSLVFSAKTFAAGLTLGFLVWGGWRLMGGEDRTPDMKDTVLWTASLFGILCVGLALRA